MIGERSRDLTTDESVELAARTNRSGDIGKSSLRIRLRKQIRIILGRTENLLLFNLLSALLRTLQVLRLLVENSLHHSREVVLIFLVSSKRRHLHCLQVRLLVDTTPKQLHPPVLQVVGILLNVFHEGGLRQRAGGKTHHERTISTNHSLLSVLQRRNRIVITFIPELRTKTLRHRNYPKK